MRLVADRYSPLFVIIKSSYVHCLPSARSIAGQTGASCGYWICTDSGLFATVLCGDICCIVVGTSGGAAGALVGRCRGCAFCGVGGVEDSIDGSDCNVGGGFGCTCGGGFG